ncbi:hypothetical protein [Streptomyces flavofungini]|uniref:hypothetical protein n=1 Tax=Streptomyces flavofungini TaxID=68200 RepID=UPI0034DED2BE
MKSLLWLVFSLAIAANALLNLTSFDGVERVLLSVCTGTVAIGAGVGLWMTRRREA